MTRKTQNLEKSTTFYRENGKGHLIWALTDSSFNQF